MRMVIRWIAVAVVAAPLSACISYSGVTKSGEQLYISGATNYFVFSQPWVRRCDVDGNQLHCEELSEQASAPRARREGAPKPAAPAPAPSPAPLPAPAPAK